jgi:hypothetical protein
MINYGDEYYIELSDSDIDKVLIEIREYLSKKSEGSMLEYILDFCDYKSYRIEEIGEIINNDKELKILLKQDCYHNKTFPRDPNIEVIDEW